MRGAHEFLPIPESKKTNHQYGFKSVTDYCFFYPMVFT